MIDRRSLPEMTRRLFGVAFRSFLSVVLITLIMGVVLGVMSYFYLQDHHWLGLIIGVLTVAESLTAGIALGAKSGFVMALVQGLRDLRLGSSMVRMVFDRLLANTDVREIGDRGNWMTQSLERLPLAQAEQRLSAVISETVNAPPSGKGLTGWFQRMLELKLLRAVERYTLKQFRDEDAKHGGVDLDNVRDHLESQVDEWLVAKLKVGVRLWTWAVLIGLPVTVIGQAYTALALSK